MEVKIKKLNKDAVIPSYAKSGDAGLDLVATSIDHSELYVEYGTSLSIEIPEGYVGLIYPRSSISKYALTLANSVGVIDSGYRGELKVRMKRHGNPYSEKQYKMGDKIAQLIIMPYPSVTFTEVDSLSDSERDSGGFGSTDLISDFGDSHYKGVF